MIGGMKIDFSSHVVADGPDRTFPESRHRSARIKKKLMKRFGGEFINIPAIFKTQYGIHAHPIFEAEIRRMFDPQPQISYKE